MCKVLIIPNVAKLDQTEVKALIKAVAGVMTERDQDGFGYAYQGAKGLYSERFLDVDRVKPMLPDAPLHSFLEACSDSSGVASKPIGGLLVHSRTSTNVTTLAATHPFTHDNVAMIHNGVCANVGEVVEYPSGNDSEMLFKHYLAGGMDRVAKSVSGYYAVGMLDGKKRQTIVIKDSTANLYSVYVAALGSLVFATTEAILDKVCKHFKEQSRTMRVKDNVHLVFSVSGALISQSSFTPIKRSFGELDARSLGYVPNDYGISEDDGPSISVPANRLESLDIYDRQGRLVPYEVYKTLSVDEQESCEVFDGARSVGGNSYV